MTAGQGDQHGDQRGQPPGEGSPPPGWPAPPPNQPPPNQPPPSQPPYGQPPYGQPPYGQPPYGQPYGYAPAPSAPGGWGREAPAPMERPVTVRAGIGAFLAALVLSAVGSVATVLNWDEFVEWMMAEAGTEAQPPELEGLDPAAFAELMMQAVIGFTVLILALQLLFLWFAWRGYNWARILLWILGGLTLLSTPFNTTSGPLPFVTALTWFQIALTAVGVVLLAAKSSNDWYRFRKWQRATGQG